MLDGLVSTNCKKCSNFSRQNSIPDETTENLDFFSDMTPVVSRQARVYVGPKAAPVSNRLGVLGDPEDVEVGLVVLGPLS